MGAQIPGSAVTKVQLPDNFFGGSGRTVLLAPLWGGRIKNETTHQGLFCGDLLWFKKLTLSQKIYSIPAKPSTWGLAQAFETGCGADICAAWGSAPMLGSSPALKAILGLHIRALLISLPNNPLQAWKRRLDLFIATCLFVYRGPGGSLLDLLGIKFIFGFRF